MNVPFKIYTPMAIAVTILWYIFPDIRMGLRMGVWLMWTISVICFTFWVVQNYGCTKGVFHRMIHAGRWYLRRCSKCGIYKDKLSFRDYFEEIRPHYWSSSERREKLQTKEKEEEEKWLVEYFGKG